MSCTDALATHGPWSELYLESKSLTTNDNSFKKRKVQFYLGTDLSRQSTSHNFRALWCSGLELNGHSNYIILLNNTLG